MKKTIITSMLCMLAVPALADVASTAYVDAVKNTVQTQIDTRAGKNGYTGTKVLQTSGDGTVVADNLKNGMIGDSAVTNNVLASGLELDKLDLGTLPESGIHIMIWNAATNKYVFEPFEDLATESLQCPAGQYDIGFARCVDPATGGDDYGYYSNDGENIYNETKYGFTTPGQWAVDFSYGVVKGIALCSSTSGSFGVAGNPNETPGSGGYCWCKMTGSSETRWVFSNDIDFADDCAYYCADSCGRYVVQHDSAGTSFRKGVFGSAGQE